MVVVCSDIGAVVNVVVIVIFPVVLGDTNVDNKSEDELEIKLFSSTIWVVVVAVVEGGVVVNKVVTFPSTYSFVVFSVTATFGKSKHENNCIYLNRT